MRVSVVLLVFVVALRSVHAFQYGFSAQGKLRFLSRTTPSSKPSAAVNENNQRLSCGVRFFLHETYMVGKSRDAKEERIMALAYAANTTFANGPDFDIHVHEIVHNAALTLPSSNSNDIIMRAQAATSPDHKACANIWMMHVQADANVVGVAYVGGSCDDSCHGGLHVGLVTLTPYHTGTNQISYQHLVDEAWILSHELGHLVGATHIDGTSVMNPNVVHYHSAANGFFWDQASLDEISAHMLDDCPHDTCLTAHSEQIEPRAHCIGHQCGTVYADTTWWVVLITLFAFILVLTSFYYF